MILQLFVLLSIYLSAGAFVALVARALRRWIPGKDLVLFLLLPLLFLNTGLLPDRTPIPVDHATALAPWSDLPHSAVYNPALSDIALQFAPWAKAVRQSWKEGSLPLRNRWNGCGTPLAANGQSAAFFPLTFLTFAVPLARGFVLLGALKLLLALTGMWLWLRELELSPAAARFGAIAFSFSFAVTPWLYHPATGVICLWPWAFFAIETLRDSRNTGRGFSLLAVVLASWPLAGHGETAALGVLFAGIWLGVRAISGDLPQERLILFKTALAGLVALGLTAFIVLPQMFAIAASNRLVIARDPNRWEYVPWVPYKPGWFGAPITSLFPLTYGDFIDSKMISGAAGSIIEMGFGYFGLVGAALVLASLRRGSARPRWSWALLALLVFSLGGAMGVPPFRFLTERIPGIGLLPPLRLLLGVSLAGSVLASLEIDRLKRDVNSNPRVALIPAGVAGALMLVALLVFRRFREAHAEVGGLLAQRGVLLWTLAVLASAALLFASMRFLRGNRWSEWAVLLLTVLSAAELIRQGVRLYRFGPLNQLFPETPLIRFLREQPSPFRVAGVGAAMFPNSNVFAGVEDVRTHDPTERRDYVEFLDLTCGYPPGDYSKTLARFDSPALDFLNVRYLVSAQADSTLPTKWKPVYSGLDGWVYENRDVLPRMFSPGEVESVATTARSDGGRVRNAVKAFGKPLQDFLSIGDFRNRALVLTETTASASTLIQNGSLTVSKLRESTNRVSFLATVTGGACFAVTSYVQDGGWTAKAGAAALPVALVNGPFLAVRLPEGTHRVELVYSPPGFRAGLVVALATAVLCAAALLLRGARRPAAQARS